MGQSEAVNRRSTDNIRVKIKRAKGRTTIYKTLHRKLKIEQHEPGCNSCSQYRMVWFRFMVFNANFNNISVI